MSRNPEFILIAEDHPVNQKVALLLLERFGYQAHAVSNGQEAVDAVAKRDYGLVLMDVMMPEMDGCEATKLIRSAELKTGNHIPIIALTALAMVGDKERCLASGMDDYITKPIDPDLLKQKIESWLHHRPDRIDRDSPGLKRLSVDPIDLACLKASYEQSELEEIFALYVKITATALANIEIKIEDRKAHSIELLAHELKGSSAAIYARSMYELSVQLENAARSHSWEVIQSVYDRLTKSFVELQDFLETR